MQILIIRLLELDDIFLRKNYHQILFMIDKAIDQYNICIFESLGSRFYERIDSVYATIIGDGEL